MKIPSDVKLALARYFNNRRKYDAAMLHNHLLELETCLGFRMDRRGRAEVEPWDKAADLAAIDAICAKRGLTMSASAGTFWFWRTNGKVTRSSGSINEDNYLD